MWWWLRWRRRRRRRMAVVTVRWRAAHFDNSQIWKEIQTWHWQELDCSKKILVRKEMRINHET